MPALVCRLFVVLICALAAGCAGRSLPPYEKPLARAPFQTVRTTAYTHTEADHTPYSNHNACGGCLRSGALNSASCDWSRWPVGTVFQLRETGERFVVDDYGWALSGTNTIDLYKPSRAAMNAWGVRRVHLAIEQWGDIDRSRAILRPRARYAHVRRMLEEIHQRYAELARPLVMRPGSALAAVPDSPDEGFVPRAMPATAPEPFPEVAANRAAPPAGALNRVVLTPFNPAR